MRLIIYGADLTKLCDYANYEGVIPNIGEEILNERLLGKVVSKSINLITQEITLFTDL